VYFVVTLIASPFIAVANSPHTIIDAAGQQFDPVDGGRWKNSAKSLANLVFWPKFSAADEGS
jgi:hypothetical protein